jgi:3-phosphoshikimate 1-carboxyvinyltransferase
VPDTAPAPLTTWPAPTAGRPATGEVRLPGSKSMTARALVLSALATGSGALRHPLRARDTTLMAAGLAALGSSVSTVDYDRWTVTPGPLAGPAHVDVGLSGTVLRFLPPVAGLARGLVTFDGDAQMRARPIAPLLAGLAEAGVALTAGPGGGLPLAVHGAGRVRGGKVVLDASASSQFVSGLLLAGAAFEQGVVVHHVGPPMPSAPHVRMSVEMVRQAGGVVDDATPDVWAVEPGRLDGRTWTVEPDLSSAAPFLAAAMVTGGEVTVPGWPARTTQPGDQLRHLLAAMGAAVTRTDAGLTVRGTGRLRGLDADLSEVSELTPVLVALAALADGPSHLRGIGHIRGHETDRLGALARELGRLGADVTQLADGLAIRPRPLRGGVFETYADHRMAHAAAVVGLVVPGVTLTDVACTAKTMPTFPALWVRLVRGEPG